MSKKNTAATIATIIVAVLAIATTLFLLYQTSQQQIQENQYNYVPSDEVNEEMNMNAVTLIKASMGQINGATDIIIINAVVKKAVQ